MRLAEGIRRVGFRKWYERELLQSHAHLAFTFICLVGVFAGAEALRHDGMWSERWLGITTMLLCLGAGLRSLRRYLYLLNHAELAAHQADCAQCKAYGRLELLQSDATGENVQVRCRQCAHVWRIDNT